MSDPDVDFIVTYGHHPTLSSTGWTAPVGYVAESALRIKHLGFSTLRFDADAHRLTVHMICGPSSTG